MYEYDDNGNKTEELTQDWNTDSAAWINNSKTSYEYDDDGNKTEELQQIWYIDSAAWVNNYKYLDKYNDNGDLIENIYQRWDVYSTDWVNIDRSTYEYDDNGNKTLYTSQYWNGDDWFSYNKTNYYWSEFEVAGINDFGRNISIYPNPARKFITVSGISNAQISLYTIEGKLVKYEKLTNNKIDLSNLSSGNYILKIESDAGIIIKKIIKE